MKGAKRARKFAAPKIKGFSKRDIVKRDGLTCFYCQKALTFDAATIDHLTPLSRGGNHTGKNVKLACLPCNSRKGNRTLDEFLEEKENNKMKKIIDVQKQKAVDYVKKHKVQLMNAARNQYAKNNERGFISVTIKDHPNNPYKSGQFYWTSESENNREAAFMNKKTENDIALENYLKTYNPKSEAVLLIWYKTNYWVTKITDTSSWN